MNSHIKNIYLLLILSPITFYLFTYFVWDNNRNKHYIIFLFLIYLFHRKIADYFSYKNIYYNIFFIISIFYLIYNIPTSVNSFLQSAIKSAFYYRFYDGIYSPIIDLIYSKYIYYNIVLFNNFLLLYILKFIVFKYLNKEGLINYLISIILFIIGVYFSVFTFYKCDSLDLVNNTAFLFIPAFTTVIIYFATFRWKKYINKNNNVSKFKYYIFSFICGYICACIFIILIFLTLVIFLMLESNLSIYRY